VAADFGVAHTFALANRPATVYTWTIGAAQAAWSAVRARCIFSASLNESTLPVSPGAAPGIGAGPDDGRPRARLLQRLARHLSSSLWSVTDDFVTTVFPSDCRVCNGPLLHSTVLPICDRCRESVPKQTDALCVCCGEALDIDMESAQFAGQLPAEGLLCYGCRAVPPMFERAVAYAVYQDELREMVHLLKYERMGGVANLLGAMLAEAILTLRVEAAQELTVIAVPLFPAKQRQRGYNQAELLADAAIAELGQMSPEWALRRVTGVLVRRRDTKSQFELNPRSRRRNLEGAFEADSSRLTPGCEVLLVDDIYTTGATARECARALRRAGARKVWVATLARAQTPKVALWDGARMHAVQSFG
jgi:ComF family protein